MSLRKRVFRIPSRTSCVFTSYKKTWKRSLLAISRSWDASAEKRLASKVAQQRQIASKLRFHILVQEVKCAWSAGGYTKNTFKKGHKTSQRCLKTIPRDVVQMRQIAIKVKVSHRCFVSWLTTSRKIPTTSEFEFTAICRVRFTFRTHETIWLRRQTCSEYVKYRTNGVQRRGWREQADNKNFIFICKFTFKLHKPRKSSL